MKCRICGEKNAQLKRPKTGEMLCKECFFDVFETEIHHTIMSNQIFTRGERVAIAASGGKDSTVLAHVMKLLNEKHDYGLDLILLSIDEGIAGYRDDSLECVKRNQQRYGIPLRIVSYKELYGWTMDEIVAQIGLTNNCTYCGVFRRQALDRGAVLLNANKIVMGHNADDLAETILMNFLRGDISRLQRCVSVMTDPDSQMPRAKPFKYSYEKEIVMYAYFKRLDYFTTECVYAPNAYRGHAREFLKNLELVRPCAIIDIIRAAEQLHFDVDNIRKQEMKSCVRCGYMSSSDMCRSCVLLDGLNRGRPRITLTSPDTPPPDEKEQVQIESQVQRLDLNDETSTDPNLHAKKEQRATTSRQTTDW